MTKDILNDMVNKNLSQYQIAKELNCSQTNVVYWLKKYDLKTKKIENKETKKCPKCSETKLVEEFYTKRNESGHSTYCKLCANEQTTIRHKNFKKLAVLYKGGKCEICGYNKYFGALDFHHIDPKEKKFSLGRFKSGGLNENIKKELNKCILVCSNCHREIHGGIIDL